MKSNFCTSSLTKRKYKVSGYSNLSCASKIIVYLITCNKCYNQYVGETKQTLSKRLSGHRSSIKKRANTFIAKHFNLPDHSVNDIRIQPIEEIEQRQQETERDLTTRRLDRERFWMLELGTVYPYGLNDRLQNVGNVSKTGLKHQYVFSLLNKRKRRKRSHGHRRNKTRNSTTTIEGLYDVFKGENGGLHSLLTMLHSLRLENLHKLFLECKSNSLNKDKRFLNMILDVCCSKLFLPVRSDNRISKVRYFIKVYYHNKGIDKVKLTNILRNKLVNSKIPLYFKYTEPPVISFSIVIIFLEKYLITIKCWPELT